jgi:hypothetical protein
MQQEDVGMRHASVIALIILSVLCFLNVEALAEVPAKTAPSLSPEKVIDEAITAKEEKKAPHKTEKRKPTKSKKKSETPKKPPSKTQQTRSTTL